MLKQIILLLFTCHGFCVETYSISTHSGWTSTRFEIQANGGKYGDVEKSSLGVRTHYKLKNKNACFGSCTARLLSWGSFCNCWKIFDVYDNGKHGFLGTIRGIDGGDSAAKFEFSDWNGTVYARATIDLEKGIVEVIQAGNAENVHLRFYAKHKKSQDLFWTYQKIDRWFNVQTMHAFAAVLADYFPPTHAYSSE